MTESTGKDHGKSGVRRERICMMEIWCECLGRERADIRKSDAYEIEAIIQKLGCWKLYDGNLSGKTRVPGYGVQKTYVREEATG